MPLSVSLNRPTVDLTLRYVDDSSFLQEAVLFMHKNRVVAATVHEKLSPPGHDHPYSFVPELRVVHAEHEHTAR